MAHRSDLEIVLRRCYDAFNTRDLDGALALMHPQVSWPNGWEGGRVEGREGVRGYWQRQWAAIDPHVEPRAFRWEAGGRVAVSVHQIVRDLAGAVVADRMVEHVFELQDGVIRRMDIRE